MRAGRPVPTLLLTQDEQKTLQQWCCRRSTAQALAFRARLILMCAEGKNNVDLANSFRVSRQTVGKWRARFIERRLKGLLDKPRPGAPRKTSNAAVERADSKNLESTTKHPKQLSIRSLAEDYKATQGTVSRLLKTFVAKPHRREESDLSRDHGFRKGINDSKHSNHFKLYGSLGPLIKDYRQWRRLSQGTLAELIGVSIRELQRWETDRCCARVENLHDISEVTGIPMQVCLALNADQPIWYALWERRFSSSSVEEAHFVKLVSDGLFKRPQDERILTKIDPITTDQQIGMILSCHRDIYGTDTPLKKDVLKTASAILPDLNYIVFDCWGHYVGHSVYLPLKSEVYEELKIQQSIESYLTSEKISDIVSLHEGVFYFYSAFAADINIAYLGVVNSVQYLAKIEQKERYVVARNAVTQAEKETSDLLGMKEVLRNAGKRRHRNGKNVPTMFEIRLDALARRFSWLEAFGYPK